jgi:hypothetical protein
MGRLAKFLRLPQPERWLLIRVTLLLSATQLALRLFPFRRVYRWMSAASQPKINEGDQVHLDAEQICAAVNKSGRNFLGVNSCFPQALVGEMLLKRGGYPATLRIGVNKEQGGELKAHAWVELDGSVVIGGPLSLVEVYTPLPELDQIKL